MCRRIENDTAPGKNSIPNIRLRFSISTQELTSISLSHDQHRARNSQWIPNNRNSCGTSTSDKYSKTSPHKREMGSRNRISEPNRKTFLHISGIVILSSSRQPNNYAWVISTHTHADLTQPILPGYLDKWPKLMSLLLEMVNDKTP